MGTGQPWPRPHRGRAMDPTFVPQVSVSPPRFWTVSDAIAGLGEPRAASAVEARQDRRRVKELERELHRTDKALAETAALLVLAKKLGAVFRDGEDA